MHQPDATAPRPCIWAHLYRICATPSRNETQDVRLAGQQPCQVFSRWVPVKEDHLAQGQNPVSIRRGIAIFSLFALLPSFGGHPGHFLDRGVWP